MFSDGLIGPARLALAALHQNEDVVDAHRQHQEGDHLHDDEGGGHARVPEHAHRARHGRQHNQHT